MNPATNTEPRLAPDPGTRARRASVAGAALSRATDRLNELLRRAEATFVAFRLGVEASVPLALPGDAPSARRTLGFEKDGAEWRLVVRVSAGPEGEPREATPLLRAPKAVRLAAALRLGPLLDELVAAAERQADEVAFALRSVESLLDGVTVPEGAPSAADDGADDGDDDDDDDDDDDGAPIPY